MSGPTALPVVERVPTERTDSGLWAYWGPSPIVLVPALCLLPPVRTPLYYSEPGPVPAQTEVRRRGWAARADEETRKSQEDAESGLSGVGLREVEDKNGSGTVVGT